MRLCRRVETKRHITYNMQLDEFKDIKRSAGLVEAQIEDNCIEHGIRGVLHHSDIEKMIALYSEEDKQARVHGKFQHLTGLVFKEFNRRVHVIKPFQITRQDFCVYERLDTHPRNPDATMWVAVDRKGTKFVVDELFINSTGLELATQIKAKASQYRVVDRRIDPSAYIEDQHTNRSLAKDLESMGLAYLPASKNRTHAIQRIHTALDYRLAGDELIKAPELYIFDTCKRTIWEMEHWQYNEWTGKTAEKKDRSEKPQDKDDHMMENLGRALIDQPTFFEMPKPQFDTVIQQPTPTLDPYVQNNPLSVLDY